MKQCIFSCFILVLFITTYAQDTTVIIENQKITLPEVFVHSNMDYPSILRRIKNDTSFYKAFRNLHIIEFSSYNDIRILNKDAGTKASWYSKTIQHRQGGCRTMKITEQQTTGNFFD